MTAADVNGERVDNVGGVGDAHGAGHFGGFFFERGEGGAEFLQFGDGVGGVLGLGSFGEGGEFLFGEQGLVGGGDAVGDGLFLRGDFFVEGVLGGEVGGGADEGFVPFRDGLEVVHGVGAFEDGGE